MVLTVRAILFRSALAGGSGQNIPVPAVIRNFNLALSSVG